MSTNNPVDATAGSIISQRGAKVVTVHVGHTSSRAAMRLASIADARRLLATLLEESGAAE